MRKINAVYDSKVIRVYQAYRNEIAEEAIKSGTFGEKFKKDRMTWIKPSFLWMMYRSGWGKKEGQERILGIDIKIEGFMEILKNSVLSHYDSKIYSSKELWEEDKIKLLGRCQWDPERDIYGNPLPYKAIQLGIKGELVEKYVKYWIIKIEDLTLEVEKLMEKKDKEEEIEKLLPREKEFEVIDINIVKKLGINI